MTLKARPAAILAMLAAWQRGRVRTRRWSRRSTSARSPAMERHCIPTTSRRTTSSTTAPISALPTSTATQLQFLFGDSWATEEYAPIEASTGSRFDDGFGSDRPARMARSVAHHAGSHPADQARAESRHHRNVGDRSRARDGSRQDADGRLQQRHARIRHFQHHQAAGLPQRRGLQRRTDLRYDARLFRRPVHAARRALHARLPRRHPGLQSPTRWLDAAGTPVPAADSAPIRPACCAASGSRTCLSAVGAEGAHRSARSGPRRRYTAMRARLADQQVHERHGAHRRAFRPGERQARLRRRGTGGTAVYSSGDVRASSVSRRTGARWALYFAYVDHARRARLRVGAEVLRRHARRRCRNSARTSRTPCRSTSTRLATACRPRKSSMS